jgi:hypothetical protein
MWRCTRVLSARVELNRHAADVVSARVRTRRGGESLPTDRMLAIFKCSPRERR